MALGHTAHSPPLASLPLALPSPPLHPTPRSAPPSPFKPSYTSSVPRDFTSDRPRQQHQIHFSTWSLYVLPSRKQSVHDVVRDVHMQHLEARCGTARKLDAGAADAELACDDLLQRRVRLSLLWSGAHAHAEHLLASLVDRDAVDLIAAGLGRQADAQCAHEAARASGAHSIASEMSSAEEIWDEDEYSDEEDDEEDDDDDNIDDDEDDDDDDDEDATSEGDAWDESGEPSSARSGSEERPVLRGTDDTATGHKGYRSQARENRPRAASPASQTSQSSVRVETSITLLAEPPGQRSMPEDSPPVGRQPQLLFNVDEFVRYAPGARGGVRSRAGYLRARAIAFS